MSEDRQRNIELTSFSKFSVDDVYDSQNSSKTKKDKHKENEGGSVSYYKLFRYADKIDYLLIIVGTIAAAIHGAVVPIIFIVFGDMTNSFVAFGKFEPCSFNYTLCKEMGIIPENTTIRDFTDMIKGALNLNDEITQYTLQYTYLACAVLVFAAVQVCCFMLQALRQVRRIRIEFFRCILRQDISFFDMNSTGELNTRLADDINRIQEGIGDKASVTFQFACRSVTGVFIGFFYGWQLTLVVLAVTPLIGIGVAAIFKVTTYYTERELDAYAKAGSIAEEVLSSIRTVFAFGGQDLECKRYNENLKRARKVGIRKGIGTGIGLGFLYMIIYVTYSIAFWYGSRLIFDGVFDPGSMLTTFSGVLIGAMSLGGAGSSMEYFSAAKAAAYKVFEIIDRVPPIDSMSEEGHKPDRVTGRIEFKNVDFTYPSRADVQVLHDVSFTAESGKSLALCGQSGCGKSTCVQLIQRFYDPQNGVVELDGVDVRTLNVKWLREHIGVVSQEPILFDTTIAENIRYGRDDVTEKEIHEATKKSNAYDFIMKLPHKFETMVGEGGAQMSGGQKQRIAIARAIVRDPKVMLLDEATSALDTESEAVVQAALDKASEGRTTIMIAHRLSTIRNADKIIGFHEGRALEAGNHHELLKVENGVYQNLVNMQSYEADEDVDQKNKINTATKRIKRTVSQDSFETEDSNVEEEMNDDDVSNFSVRRVLSLNKPELLYIVLGCFAAAINGGSQPFFAIIFSEMLVVFTLTDREEQEQRIIWFSLGFFALGIISFFANTIQASSFAKSGEELTSRLRSQGFKAILRQNIGYFDDHLNSTGALTTRLATDASKVQGCTGVQAGVAIQSIFALGCTLVISFVYGWRLTFVTLAFIPMVMIAGIISVNMMTGKAGEVSKSYEEAGQIASEATINMRTVASLGREDRFFAKYNKALDLPYNKSLNKAYIFGVSFGFSQCVMFFAFAATFRYGAWLVTQQLMNFEDIFTCLMAVVFGALAAGQTTSFAPDYAEAKLSAARMFRLFDSVPAIDSYSTEGEKLNTVNGKINYENIKFNYPTRPDVQVLKGLTAKVLPGQTVALVGQSGCGKSTCIQLLERFYDPVEGDVLLENKNLKNLRISWFRSKMGIVSQEPVLFDRSIADNIRYGDNTRYADMKEVVAAAKNANIHDFIESLSQAYETNVGAKGTQLSGGQKQRVAIARALLRNPKVLLLDEATSALDAESEKVVQDALDAASQGRTTIIIAHRLSTVKNADVIAVIENGSVVETGTHAELIALKGSYFSLVNAQLHHKNE